MQTSLFEAILNTNIINFIILVWGLSAIFKKFNVGKFIDKMALDIQSRVEKSSLDTQNALAEYKTIKKSTKDTPKLQEEIVSKAKTTAQNIKIEIEEKTVLKQNELQTGFEKTNNNLEEKYKKLTTNEIYSACINIAQEEVVKRLNPELHKKLIHSSIDELDKIESELL